MQFADRVAVYSRLLCRQRWVGGIICVKWFLFVVFVLPLSAQKWDIPAELGNAISSHTDGKLKIAFEQRVRYENRGGNSFGGDPDVFTGLARTRLALTYENSWLKVSGMLQDSRAPWYGPNAPASVRDAADLHEAYVELFPKHKTGFNMLVGRLMLNYGEGRLIGTPQWGNTSRTYDHVRLSFGSRRAHVDALLVSPVKVRTDGFNYPVLGDRVWGVYATVPEVWNKTLLDVYLLRRDQNRPGGFSGGSKTAGTDQLGVNTFGFRLAGPLSHGWTFSIEGVAQNGHVGFGDHRAAAWFSGLSRHWTVHGKSFDLSGEYKFASGSRNPQDATRSRTFDQLYAANHDKFGHEDLFGWRNIHDARSLATYAVVKSLALNVMYNNIWLASACDSLYNGSGRAIARSINCAAGTHVGQEADIFAVYRYKRLQLGAGYGYFFPGDFIRRATPGAAPSYIYVFHTYSL